MSGRVVFSPLSLSTFSTLGKTLNLPVFQFPPSKRQKQGRELGLDDIYPTHKIYDDHSTTELLKAIAKLLKP